MSNFIQNILKGTAIIHTTTYVHVHTFWMSFIGRTNNSHITIKISIGERIVE